jgi:hypothetical protein
MHNARLLEISRERPPRSSTRKSSSIDCGHGVRHAGVAVIIVDIHVVYDRAAPEAASVESAPVPGVKALEWS